MAAMRVVGAGHRPPAHARVHEHPDEYVIELDVGDFVEAELSVEAAGPLLTVRADHVAAPGDDGEAFRLHERLEESFRLPDDADADRTKVFYRHGTLEIHAPRVRLEPHRLPVERRSFLSNPNAEPC